MPTDQHERVTVPRELLHLLGHLREQRPGDLGRVVVRGQLHDPPARLGRRRDRVDRVGPARRRVHVPVRDQRDPERARIGLHMLARGDTPPSGDTQTPTALAPPLA